MAMRHIHLTLAVLAATFLAPSSGVAQTADPRIALELTNERRTTGVTACAKWHRHSWYRAGDRVGFAGRTSDVAPGTVVRIVVRRCIDGRYRLAMRTRARVRSDGSFRGRFPVGEPSNCFVRARIGTVASPRRYFHVTS